MEQLPKIGTYDFLVEPFHCDFSKHLFVGHLGNHMLNAADFHSNDRGYGMNYLNTVNKTWVLSRLVIEMDEYPLACDHIQVSTWIDSVMRYFTSRNFKVTDKKGKVYGYGKSIWAMIDTESRQPIDLLKVRDGLISSYIDKETECPIDKPSRVMVGEEARLVRSVPTYYNDVDMNGHINSVKYIEHVLDLWNVEFYRQHTLKRLEIAYVAESHQGDVLNLYVESDTPTDLLNGKDYSIKITKSDTAQKEIEVCRVKVLFF